MCKYYCDLNFQNKSIIYTSLLNDYYRYIITRWRLSNHDLSIETGRYSRPITPREDRLCETCNKLEDEYHVVFVCPLYYHIRIKYHHIITSETISKFLNPNFNQMKDTAQFLHEIEEWRRGSKNEVIHTL